MTDLTWFTSSPAGKAIGWAVVHSFWQLSLIAIGLRVLLRLIPQRKPEVRYAALLGGLILAVVWAGITFRIAWQEETLDVAPITVMFETPQLTVPKATDLTTPTQSLTGQVQQLMQQLDGHMPIISMCWMIGTVLFSLYLLFGLFYIKFLQHSRVSLPSDLWEDRLRELARGMGIRRQIRLYLSERVKTPITFQLFRPVILMPVSIFTGLSPVQIEVLLLHELAHIRRYDFAINLLQSLVEIIFFYHPAIWWICGKIREEREYACDRAVMKVQDDPFPYVEALTQVQSYHYSIKNKLAMSANTNQSLLSKRVYRLFGRYDREPIRYKSILFACLMLLFFSAQAFISTGSSISRPDAVTVLDTLPIQNDLARGDNPLFVVNGVIKDWKTPKDGELDPNNIQAISVLKGQQAVDKYGEKGNNGVIEITTKSAASEKTESTPPAPVQMENKIEKPQSGSPVISGVVQNEEGLPMIGTSIIVKGTTVGTISDLEGNFQLKLPTACADLVFSYVGMETKEIKDLCNDAELKVVMEKKAVTAKEATVIAIRPSQKVDPAETSTVVDPAPFRIRVDPSIMAVGKVVNEQNDPLIGATVIIKGTNMGTITDLDGDFVIRVPDNCATLVFHYTGLEAGEVSNVCGGDTLQVLLRTEQPATPQSNVPEAADNAGTRVFSGFKVFPNPASDEVNISFNLEVPRKIDLSIYTLDGKKIKTLADQSLDTGFQQFRWQPGPDIKGIFQVIMYIDGNPFKRQVVIE